MPELLLEIFSEEIPARMQARAADDLARLIGEGLKAEALVAERLEAHAGPRRLVLVAHGLPAAQPDSTDERKGPQVGAPAAAIQGFLKASGLADIAQAEQRTLAKGQFYFAVISRKGRPTVEVLKDVIEAALAQLPWPKSMRWATNPTRWVRPVQSVLCIFGGAVVPVSFAGRAAGDSTFGHRFLKPDLIHVDGYADYRDRLQAAHVLVEAPARAKIIAAELARLAAAENLIVRDDPALLAEVTGLVEWPVPLLGTIDAAFMDVPAEVLTSAMRKHQKYFALAHKDGRLANRFGVVANMSASDGGKAIVAGNERVLRARLSDAKFFWDQDRAHTLESRVPKLKERVFHAKLGSVFDKVARIVPLADWLERFIPGAAPRDVRRAAYLCKADLSTGMVGEFPDLQGVMGRYYALHDGETPGVSGAIAGHYSPAGPHDACQSDAVSVAVALSDKIDSLVGFFAIDEKPTGSKDPFALRRAALGVIRLILENKLRVPLLAAFEYAHGNYNGAVAADKDKVARELLDFFADRLKAHLKDVGVRHDLVSAVFALGNEDDLVRLMARVEALAAFLASDDGANLLVAYRRAVNIVRIEEKKDDTGYRGEVSAGDLGAPEAAALLVAIGKTQAEVDGALVKEDFVAAMMALAGLRRPVDAFFDKVTVNCDDRAQRAARLRLLSRIGAAMGRVGDFSQIEG